jgi:CTP-dependent riboflavin kinase
MNDKENIEQNSLQQGQVIRNTKKRRQTTKTTYISQKRTLLRIAFSVFHDIFLIFILL